jgi:transposase-like protein
MSRSLSTFRPPHCPRTQCAYHHCAKGWRWARHGSYTRAASPCRIPRFRCGHCGATFSTQTFSVTYWCRRPDLLIPVARGLLACSGYRQIARGKGCKPPVVMRLAARIGRHALLLLWEMRPRRPIEEPLVVDGFESFAWSQFHPLYLNLVVGASHYCYGFTISLLRRKGSMTAAQKRQRVRLEGEHGRPDPRAIQRDTAAAIRLAAPEPQPLVVRSDEHMAYPRALRSLVGYDIRHERTSSLAARTAGNPLFPVNRLDGSLRHNSANHKRETIAFSKLHQAALERAAWLLAWQNLAKPFSEKEGRTTPAMMAGHQPRRWGVAELLQQRLFPSRVRLPAVWAAYYRGEVRTAPVRHQRRHQLKLAY